MWMIPCALQIIPCQAGLASENRGDPAVEAMSGPQRINTVLGLYILIFFIAIVLLVYWTRANDAVPLGGRTKGLFQMIFTEDGKTDPPDGSPRATPKPTGRSDAGAPNPKSDGKFEPRASKNSE
jgi:hypothetical protein